MIYAIDQNGERIEASPGSIGCCESCNTPLIPKCGEIKTWHWAHKANDCDPWHETETKWHIEWKEQFPADWRERTIRKDDIFHRADVLTSKGVVVELQHSPIASDCITERELYYDNMVWIIDAHEFNICPRKQDGNYVTFRWKHPRSSWFASRKQLYFDIDNENILKVSKIYPNIPCGGWGYTMTKAALMEQLTNN